MATESTDAGQTTAPDDAKDEGESGAQGTKGKADDDGNRTVSKVDFDAALADAKGYRRRAQAAEAELSKLREAGKSDEEKAVAAAEKAGYDKAMTEVRERLFHAEARGRAAGKVIDLDVAVALLKADDVVGENGDIDIDALDKAIDKLVKDKPFLKPHGFKGNGDVDQGAKGEGGGDGAGLSMNDLLRSAANR